MDKPSQATAKVVDLTSRQSAARADQSAASTGLAGMLQRKVRQALSDGLEAAFKAIDDDLFKRSESQQSLFESLRELRRRQPLLTRTFLEAIDRQVLQVARQATPPPAAAQPATASPLALVEEGELEETLALSRMVAAAESALAGEIAALRERAAVLRGGVDPESVEPPATPQAVAHAFRDALAVLPELPLPERLIAYKHFERQAMGALGPLYHDLNAALAAAGVLPDLKPQVLVRNHAAPAPAAGPSQDPDPAATSPSGVPAPSAPAAASGGQAGLSPQEAAAWNDLRSAVASLRTPGSGGTGPAADLRDLGEAIAALREIHSLLGQLNASGVAPQEVKAHLLERLGQGTPAAKSLGEHEEAIDMVGLVFDHILNDPDLPPPMQAQLARLQVPFLKVAVLEPHLFAKAEHPARRLLDLLGETGKSWTREADRDNTLYDRIRQTVEIVNREFVDDPRIFERQLERFKGFMDEVDRRASVSRQRAEEVARSREKMEQSHSTVTRAMIEITAGKPLPEWARVLLLRHWASYMVLLVLREGEASPAYQAALEFPKAVVRAPAARDPAARQALEQATDALVEQLRHGLSTLNLPKEDIGRLADTLRAYLEMHSGKGGLVMPPLPSLPPLPMAGRLAGRPTAQPSEPALQAVGKLKVDDWVELTDDNGRRSRGKVSWISGFTRRLLLVTLAGTRLAEKSQHDLALMVDRGQARLLPDRPLFDRAMDSITRKLRGG